MPTDAHLARQVMGQNFVGVDAVEQHLAVKLNSAQRKLLHRIPFSEQVLQQRRETHLLVAGYPLTLHDLRNRFPRLLDDAESPWYAGQAFADRQVRLRWYLVRRGIVPASVDKTWPEQQRLLSREEVPWVCELVYAVLLYFLQRGVRLLKDGEFARCRDKIERYANLSQAGVMVGTFEDDGLRIKGMWRNYRLYYLGVASSQILPPE